MTWRNIGDDPTLEGMFVVLADDERAGLGGCYAVDEPDGIEVDVHRPGDQGPVPAISTEPYRELWSNRLRVYGGIRVVPYVAPERWLYWDGEGWINERNQLVPGPRVELLLDPMRAPVPRFEQFTP